jgi:serine/threonine protein kinase
LEGHQVGPAADIWSLGIVLLECLTGRRVYEGTPGEIVGQRLTGPVPLPADLPVSWKLALSGMVDLRPDLRLDGTEVAALLATSPFQAPWIPTATPASVSNPSTIPHDLTGAVPGVAATDILGGDTRVVRSTPSVIPPSPRDRRWRFAALGVLAAAAVGLGLFFWLSSSPARRPPTLSSTGSSRSTTTVPPTTSSTTTTLPSGPTALAALVGAIASGETAGTIDSGSGQTISNQAGQAITDEAAGKPNQAANDLQQAAMAIATGVQNGNITQAEGVTLQSDLATLATALGLSAASTPPTIQPGPTPRPGHGHGKGD